MWSVLMQVNQECFDGAVFTYYYIYIYIYIYVYIYIYLCIYYLY